MKMGLRSICLLGVALASVTFSSAHAAAATISSIASAITDAQLCGVGPMPNCLTTPVFNPPLRNITEYSGDLYVSNTDASGTTEDGSVVVSAEAAMASGTLRVVATGTDIAGSQGPHQGAYAFATSSARLGDTFTLHESDGALYGGTGTSRMSLDLDGVFLGSFDSDLLLSISIGIYQPGYFDAQAAGDSATASALRLASRSIWFFAGDALPEDFSLDFSSHPHSSFEWTVEVWASFGFRQDSDGHKFAVADLGHTVTLSFDSPDGTYYTSHSGLFPGSGPTTNAVSEPGTGLMLTLGFLGLGLARRRAAAHSLRAV